MMSMPDQEARLRSIEDPREFVVTLMSRDPENLSATDEWLIETFIAITRELQKTPDNPEGEGKLQLELTRTDDNGRYDSSCVLSIYQFEAAVCGFAIGGIHDPEYADKGRKLIVARVAENASAIRNTLSAMGTDINFYNTSREYMSFIDDITQAQEGPAEYLYSLGNRTMNVIRQANRMNQE